MQESNSEDVFCIKTSLILIQSVGAGTKRCWLSGNRTASKSPLSPVRHVQEIFTAHTLKFVLKCDKIWNTFYPVPFTIYSAPLNKLFSIHHNSLGKILDQKLPHYFQSFPFQRKSFLIIMKLMSNTHCYVTFSFMH